MSKDHSRIIAVFGGSRAQVGSVEYAEAYAVGSLLARAGFIVLNGGYQGTMEASARGAKENGGRVIGILSGEFGRLAPNAYLDEIVRSQDLFTRIRAMHTRADGFIVLKGSMGTLAELALVWNLARLDAQQRKPIILLGEAWMQVLRAWREHLTVTEEETNLLQVVARPEEAVALLISCLVSNFADTHPSPRAPSPAK